jgi:hypothetical protein
LRLIRLFVLAHSRAASVAIRWPTSAVIISFKVEEFHQAVEALSVKSVELYPSKETAIFDFG